MQGEQRRQEETVRLSTGHIPHQRQCASSLDPSKQALEPRGSGIMYECDIFCGYMNLTINRNYFVSKKRPVQQWPYYVVINMNLILLYWQKWKLGHAVGKLVHLLRPNVLLILLCKTGESD